MHPTRILRSGDSPVGKYGKYLNHATWGNFEALAMHHSTALGEIGADIAKLAGTISKTRGIISYSLSSNRQNPMAGVAHDAIFNTWRRFSKQVLYWAPPLFTAYYLMSWAIRRNEYLNSKAGRAEFSDSE